LIAQAVSLFTSVREETSVHQLFQDSVEYAGHQVFDRPVRKFFLMTCWSQGWTEST